MQLERTRLILCRCRNGVRHEESCFRGSEFTHTVQGIHDRAEQRAFRETIDHEIGLNLFMYRVRSRQFACDAKRVDELFEWLAHAGAGEQVPVLYPVMPITLTPYRSAWDNQNSSVLDELPARQRQKYAEFYDELSNNSETMAAERAQWRLLSPYKEIGGDNLGGPPRPSSDLLANPWCECLLAGKYPGIGEDC